MASTGAFRLGLRTRSEPQPASRRVPRAHVSPIESARRPLLRRLSLPVGAPSRAHCRAMDVVHTLPAFVLAVLLISASPGPAIALILRRAALRGFRGAVPTVLGLETGLYVWALLAAAGLSALVAASEVGFIVLRVAGAVVLVVLGLRSWRAVLRDKHEAAGEEVEALDSGGTRPSRAFGEGVLVQLATPKAAVFMVAFYPQFVPDDRPLFATTALLALLQVTLETA